MKRSKKIWLFVVIGLINLIVILSFIFLTKRIRTDEKLKLSSTEIPAQSRDLLF